MKTGVQLYSVRTDMQKDVFTTLKAIRSMGYDGVEFAGLFGHSAKELRAMCSELGLEPISAHVSLNEMLADTEGVMKTYAEIGCKFMAIPYLEESDRPGHGGFEAVIRNAERIGKIAKANGITLLYHNHNFEFEKIDNEYALDVLYSRVPADCLQTEIDTCWANVAGVDPAAYIRKYKGRAPIVHLKDFYKKGQTTGKLYKLIGLDDKEPQPQDENETFGFRPVGMGMQDVPSLLAAAADAGAEWVIVEQDETAFGMSRMDSVKASIDYLKTLTY